MHEERGVAVLRATQFALSVEKGLDHVVKLGRQVSRRVGRVVQLAHLAEVAADHAARVELFTVFGLSALLNTQSVQGFRHFPRQNLHRLFVHRSAKVLKICLKRVK